MDSNIPHPQSTGWKPLPEDDPASVPAASSKHKETPYLSDAQSKKYEGMGTPHQVHRQHNRTKQRKRPIYRFALIMAIACIMIYCAMLVLERLLWPNGWNPYHAFPIYAPIAFLVTIPAAWWVLKRNLHALLILTGTVLILGLFFADGSQIMFDLGSSNDYAPIPIGIIVIFALVLLWQSMNKHNVGSTYPTRKDPRNVVVNPLEGRVIEFQERFEDKRTADKDVRLTVWSFRLERYNEQGVRLAPIPVQMRGEAFSGFISNGDTVRLYGNKWREGQLFRTDRLFNDTNNIEVRATKATITSGKMLMYFAGLLIWLLTLAFLAGLFFLR